MPGCTWSDLPFYLHILIYSYTSGGYCFRSIQVAKTISNERGPCYILPDPKVAGPKAEVLTLGMVCLCQFRLAAIRFFTVVTF